MLSHATFDMQTCASALCISETLGLRFYAAIGLCTPESSLRDDYKILEALEEGMGVLAQDFVETTGGLSVPHIRMAGTSIVASVAGAISASLPLTMTNQSTDKLATSYFLPRFQALKAYYPGCEIPALSVAHEEAIISFSRTGDITPVRSVLVDINAFRASIGI